jgi:hypothetical protein
MISPRNFQPYWLRERMEHVAVVGHPIAAWAHVPNRLDVVGGSVPLQRFVSDDAETLVIIGEHGHALSLFVIPRHAGRPAQTLLHDVRHSSVEEPATGSMAEQYIDQSLDDAAFSDGTPCR